MPKIWTDTLAAHRREVSDAIIATTAALAAEHGFRAVTMGQIAEAAGVSRATLYNYFPDVEAVLAAWHDRRIRAHLDQPTRARVGADGPLARLEAMLASYAAMVHTTRTTHEPELVALLHGNPSVAAARHQLHDLIGDPVAEAVAAGTVRADVPTRELAAYCLHALGAAHDARSKAAVRRLVTVLVESLAPR